MNRINLLIPTLALALSTGCDQLHWLQPIYTERDVVQEPAFEGRWSDGGKNTFTVRAEGGRYHISADKDEFDATLMRLAGELYIDLVERGAKGIPEHLFFRIELESGHMRWYSLKEPVVREALAQGRLEHVRMREGKATRWVVTSSPWEVQNFLLGNRGTAWEELEEFRKVVP